MGKIKSELVQDVKIKMEIDEQIDSSQISYTEKLRCCSPIAHPMAHKKLAKKCFKLMKKASGKKENISCGLKLVQKKIRKGHKGIVIFAGDISPIDIISHLPGVCEDKSIPYCYVPSRLDIGTALGVKRGCLVVMIEEREDFKELYSDCQSEIKLLPSPL